MKKIFLLILLACTLQDTSIAQTVYAFTASATSSNSIPLGNTNNKRQGLYFPSDFPGAPSGNITKIYIKLGSSATANFTNLEIKMGSTALAAFTAGPFITAGMSTVFFAASHSVVPTTITGFPGDWMPITLTTPFYYDNTQNFILDVSQGGYSPGYSLPLNNTIPSSRTLYGNTTTGTGSLQARLYQLAIEISPANCTGTPDVATITGPAAPVCTGTSVALGVTGHSTGTTYTYKWQSRPAGSSGAFVDEPGATSPSYNATPTQSTEYQFITTCTSSSLSSTSLPFTVDVLQVPSASGINETHLGLAYDFNGINVQNASTLLWDFGDGNTSSSGSHTYVVGGNYTVTLTMTNSCGSANIQTNITATPNEPCTTPDKPTLSTENTIVCTGAPFDVEAEGYTLNLNISFQWQRSPAGMSTYTDINGETNTTLSTSDVEDVEYRLVSTCSSTGNITISDPISIQVIPVPKVVAPENVSVLQFQNAVFSTGSSVVNAPVNYRWQSQAVDATDWVYIVDNGNYRGALTSTLTVLSATIAQDGMKFRCVLEENGGCNFAPDISPAATLSVNRSTSVADRHQHTNITVYPNPVSGSELFIMSDTELPEGTRVSITDVTGRQLISESIDSKNAVNISALSAGNYYIRILNENNPAIHSLMFTKE